MSMFANEKNRNKDYEDYDNYGNYEDYDDYGNCDVFENEEGIVLLKQKLTDAMLKNKSVIVTISNSIIECRNTFYLDEGIIEDDCLSLCSNNYELFINLNEVVMSYDDLYEDQFIFTHGDDEISIYFLE